MEIRLISIIKKLIFQYTPNLFQMCSVKEKVSSKSLGNIAHPFSPWRSTHIKDSEFLSRQRKPTLFCHSPHYLSNLNMLAPTSLPMKTYQNCFWKTCAECQFGEIRYTRKVSCQCCDIYSLCFFLHLSLIFQLKDEA